MKIFQKSQTTQKPLNTLERQKEIERRAKRAYALFACLVLSMAVMVVPAFAADDPLQIVENLSDFIFSLMREVAVTEGDKVEVQTKLGWQANTWAIGDLVKEMNAVTEAEIDALMETYKASYNIATGNTNAIRYQAREEIAIKKMMDAEGCRAFSNTFQDLYGMEQLPGLASQHLMSQGCGYGGEGDWKVSAMTAILKAMGEGGNGCSLFMEDYTYNLAPGAEYSLGAHMLEVCPCCAGQRPRIETHHLGIGMNEKDPARLVFEGKEGEPSWSASLTWAAACA